SAHTGADAGFGAAGILSQWSVDYRCPELDLGRYLARSAHANRGFGGRALKRDRARGQQSRPRPGARRARLSTEWIAFQLCDARFANDPHMVQRIILTSKAGAAPENASSENAS